MKRHKKLKWTEQVGQLSPMQSASLPGHRITIMQGETGRHWVFAWKEEEGRTTEKVGEDWAWTEKEAKEKAERIARNLRKEEAR